MSDNKPSKRLADVTKKSTTDRASMLVASFIPKPPSSSPTTILAIEPEPVSTPPSESAAMTTDQDSSGGENETSDSGIETMQADKSALPARERTRRSTTPTELRDLITQGTPEGVRFTHMIMLCDDHHEMMRELAFRTKKPMTQIMFNLLEVAQQTLQRENKKGN